MTSRSARSANAEQRRSEQVHAWRAVGACATTGGPSTPRGVPPRPDRTRVVAIQPAAAPTRHRPRVEPSAGRNARIRQVDAAAAPMQVESRAHSVSAVLVWLASMSGAVADDRGMRNPRSFRYLNLASGEVAPVENGCGSSTAVHARSGRVVLVRELNRTLYRLTVHSREDLGCEARERHCPAP